jgi:acyl carrier protein
MRIEETLRNIVARIAETSADFAPDAHLRNDLGVDSVRAFEIAFEVERSFAITLPDPGFGSVRTFADLSRLVASIKC